MKNKFTFLRINISLEEKRSAIGEMGNFDLRYPWISFTSFGGFALNFINIDEPYNTYRLQMHHRKSVF